MALFRSVMITGASSGLGRALALACAAPDVILHLSGRNTNRLEETASTCQARGTEVRIAALDVCDAEAMRAWIREAGRLDLVVANAGISAGTGDGTPETPAQTRALFAVNLGGVLNTVLPAMEVMASQAADAAGMRGHIAVVASIAAFVPAPGAPAYCASKAAIDAWTVAAAPTARRQGILLTSICPGYVRTPMTAPNRFPMPGLMDADLAASKIVYGLAAGKTRIVFPWWVAAAARLTGLLPPRLSAALLSMPPGKDALANEG
jgi:short-subunit dehydrogenase